jgi:hypothetical protein
LTNSNFVNRNPFYNSWIGLIVFIFILIFQPGNATFFAFRPSDFWLLLCLFLQYKNGYNTILPFRSRLFLRNYGLYFGVLAIIATLVQAFYINLSFDISFVAQFYRFLRYLLIFKFVENLLANFTSDDSEKFWRTYTLMGIFILILSFLEFNDIGPFKMLMMNLYYSRPEDTIDEYIIQADRLAGVMGNPNTTAILLVTTIIYPLLNIVNKGSRLMKRMLYLVYVLGIVYALVVMTGSRTAIFISLLMIAIILLATSRRLKDLILVVVVALFVIIIGAFFYQQFKSEIVIQDRISESIQGPEFQFSLKGIGEWTGRYYVWQDRITTFQSKGNQLAILIGMGYTQAYEDYADNGLLSTFINNGLIGLILKLFLFYIFITSGFFRAIRFYFHFKMDYPDLVFAVCAFALLLMELTIDLIDHYKLGQLFYLFLSMIMIINGKIFSTNSR